MEFSINLLPTAGFAKKVSKINKTILKLIGSLILIAILIAVIIYGYKSSIQSAVNNEVANLSNIEQQISIVNHVDKHAESLETWLQNIEKRENFIAKIGQGEIDYNKYRQEFQRLTSKNISLSNLIISSQEIQISGTAKSWQDIPQFMASLETSPLLTKPALVSSNIEEREEKTIRFSIKTGIKNE